MDSHREERNALATWLITGADRGIGAAMCACLARQGRTVIGACLAAEPEELSPGVEIIGQIDVTSPQALASLADCLSGRQIDVLVHNAGRVSEGVFSQLDFAAMQQDYAVNALGPLRVTQALMPCLGPGSKIGIVTSRVGSLSENQSGGLWGYRMSKAAANMAVRNLAHEFGLRALPSWLCIRAAFARA